MRDYKETLPDLTIEADPSALSGFTRKPHLKPNLTQESLDEIMAIPPESLALNQRGRLTREQQAAIVGTLNEENDGMRLLMTIFLGVSLLLAFIFLGQNLPMVYLVVGAGVMIGAMLAFFFRRQRQKRVDLAARVERVDGIPQLRALGRLETPTHFVMIVSGQLFQISRQVYEKLETYELPVVRVYHTAKSKQLLSIEVRQSYGGEKLKNDLLDYADGDDEKRKNDELPLEDEPAEIEGRK